MSVSRDEITALTLPISSLYLATLASPSSTSFSRKLVNQSLKSLSNYLTLLATISSNSSYLLASQTKAPKMGAMWAALLMWTDNFNILLACQVNYMKLASPQKNSSKITKPSSMAVMSPLAYSTLALQKSLADFSVSSTITQYYKLSDNQFLAMLKSALALANQAVHPSKTSQADFNEAVASEISLTLKSFSPAHSATYFSYKLS